jgi:hypothetical protein
MKKTIFALMFAAAAVMSGATFYNTSLCSELLQDDVNSYTETQGGVCDGAPAKCANGGCYAASCYLETTVYWGFLGQKHETVKCSKTAGAGEFACCWAIYVEGQHVPQMFAEAYPLTCCNR